MDKEKMKILDEIFKNQPRDIIVYAVNEIWQKGATHFTIKTLNATLSYWQEEANKSKTEKVNRIISLDTQIAVYKKIKDIVMSKVSIFDIIEYLTKKKIL